MLNMAMSNMAFPLLRCLAVGIVLGALALTGCDFARDAVPEEMAGPSWTFEAAVLPSGDVVFGDLPRSPSVRFAAAEEGESAPFHGRSPCGNTFNGTYTLTRGGPVNTLQGIEIVVTSFSSTDAACSSEESRVAEQATYAAFQDTLHVSVLGGQLMLGRPEAHWVLRVR